MRLAPLVFKKSIIVITFLILCLVFWGYWLNQSLKKFSLEGDSSIGQLSYLTDDVSRRSSYLPFWQTLSIQSSIDHLDQLNTNQSNVTIVSMNDGTVLNLGKNSLLSFKRWRKSYRLSLVTGSLSIKNSIYPLQIETEQGNLLVKPMTQMSIIIRPEAITMMVSSGKVKLKGSQTVKAGEQTNLQQDFTVIETSQLSLLKPLLNDLYYTDSSLSALIDFKRSHPIELEDRVEISRSPLFIEQIITIKPQGHPLSLSTNLDAGNYFWRYLHHSSYSETGNFMVEPLHPPQLLNPDRTDFKRDRDSDGVILHWKDSPQYTFYHIELSNDRLFKGAVKRYGVQSSPLSLYHLASGHYFYRIIAETHDKTEQDFSQTREFMVSTLQHRSKPKTLIPRNGAIFDVLQDKIEIFFNWDMGQNVNHQELLIATSANLSDPFIRQKSDYNFLSLMVPADKLKTFYWQIEAITQQGEKIYSNISSYHFTPTSVTESSIIEDGTIALDPRPVIIEDGTIALDPRPVIIEDAAKPSNDLLLKLLQPSSNSRINTITMDQLLFRWQGQDSVLVDFEISDRQDFSTIIDSRKNLQSSVITVAPPPPGRYYWRLRYTLNGVNVVTEVLAFNIEWSLPPIQLLNPSHNMSFQSNEASRGLILKWAAPRAKNFIMTIAQDELFNKPLFKHQGSETTITLPPLDNGQYYAKIEGTAQNGADYPATTHAFSIEPYRPAAPVSLSPDKNMVVDMTNQDDLLFSWLPSDEVTDHTLTLYKLDATLSTGRQAIHTKTLIRANSYRFNRLTQLAEGEFYWTIQSFVRTTSNSISTSSNIAEGFFSLSLDSLPSPTITSPVFFKISDSPSQRISWNAIDNASRYHIVISTNDQRQVKVIDTTTASLFITPRLTARSYNVSIVALTKFGKAADNITLMELTVEP